jgi:hypothetical protein
VLSFGVAIAERSQKWDSLLRAPFFWLPPQPSRCVLGWDSTCAT